MKFAIAAITFTALAHGITLTADKNDAESQAANAELIQEQRTIVGFLFQGFDFGALWQKLTQEERDSIKQNVFDRTLELNDLDPKNYKDMIYKMSAEEKAAL